MSSTKIDALYILSPGHSGSTLLNLILGSHPDAIAVSELTHLPKNIAHNEPCTCGKPIRECPHWRAVSRLIAARIGIDMMHEPRRIELGFIGAPQGPYKGSLMYRTLWRARRMTVYFSQRFGVPLPAFMCSKFSRGIEHRLALYDAVREAGAASVVVDASKGYLPGIATYERRPDRVRFILLTRDGRAVFHSNVKRGFGSKYALRVWRNYYRRGLPVISRRVDPAHVLRLRYEDLATDPEREIRRICDFAGLEYDSAMLDTRSKQHHITSGNNMRFGASDSIKLDTKWRTGLTREQLAHFEKHAGATNRQLGYE